VRWGGWRVGRVEGGWGEEFRERQRERERKVNE
jgi:hypothetical protein